MYNSHAWASYSFGAHNIVKFKQSSREAIWKEIETFWGYFASLKGDASWREFLEKATAMQF